MIDPCFCGDLLLYLAKIGIMEKFRAIRRKDRVWDEAAARELLDRGEYGFLAMCGVGGYGYGLPMSYVAIGSISIVRPKGKSSTRSEKMTA